MEESSDRYDSSADFSDSPPASETEEGAAEETKSQEQPSKEKRTRWSSSRHGTVIFKIMSPHGTVGKLMNPCINGRLVGNHRHQLNFYESTGTLGSPVSMHLSALHINTYFA